MKVTSASVQSCLFSFFSRQREIIDGSKNQSAESCLTLTANENYSKQVYAANTSEDAIVIENEEHSQQSSSRSIIEKNPQKLTKK